MRIWIVNNYAIPPRFGGLVRHYYFSKFLRQAGHDVRIITGSQVHNTTHNFADPGQLIKEMEFDGVPYTYVNTMAYTQNNWRRIVNMLQFTFRCTKAMQQLYDAGERPDVIYASSPLPMSSWTAQRFAKKYGIPFVFEVRDLWPESLVEYGHLEKKPWTKPITAVLYALEHSLYRGSDRIVFTMQGGADYIADKGWRDVDRAKVRYLNNGVDLEEFHRNLETVNYDDPDLDDLTTFKVVYTGSIRMTYGLDQILDLAKRCQEELPRVRFYFYGEGPERPRLMQRASDEGITNVAFKGKVKKEEIPGILSRGDVGLAHNTKMPLVRYGTSNNKLFEYLAAGLPVLSTVRSNHSVIEAYDVGLDLPDQKPDTLFEGVKTARGWSEERRREIQENCRRAVAEYDYRALTAKLEKILEDVSGKEGNIA